MRHVSRSAPSFSSSTSLKMHGLGFEPGVNDPATVAAAIGGPAGASSGRDLAVTPRGEPEFRKLSEAI